MLEAAQAAKSTQGTRGVEREREGKWSERVCMALSLIETLL